MEKFNGRGLFSTWYALGWTWCASQIADRYFPFETEWMRTVCERCKTSTGVRISRLESLTLPGWNTILGLSFANELRMRANCTNFWCDGRMHVCTVQNKWVVYFQGKLRLLLGRSTNFDIQNDIYDKTSEWPEWTLVTNYVGPYGEDSRIKTFRAKGQPANPEWKNTTYTPVDDMAKLLSSNRG